MRNNPLQKRDDLLSMVVLLNIRAKIPPFEPKSAHSSCKLPVGLPAYTMESPVPYAMESGSPHAKYAILSKTGNSWQVEHVLVPYNWEQAANIARNNHRPDWAQWLATGREH